jgi:F-type H+-transporting ATPase subunit b
MEHGTHFLFWKTVNTVILIAILYWFLKKPISKFISDGINAVVSRFEKAKQDKEEVLRLLKEAEKKSEEAKAEAERILQYSKELAAKEREQIIAEAKKKLKLNIKIIDGQKEAFFAEKKCITVRDETEWTELVEHGFNILTGADKNRIISAVNESLKKHADFSIDLYGGGQASEIIYQTLKTAE